MNDVLGRRGLPEDADFVSGARERQFQFPLAALSPENITEQGDVILEGRARLVRLPSLEGVKWTAPLEIIEPNPEQPREYFDPKKLEELRATLQEVGQRMPIAVVPVQILAAVPSDQGNLPAIRLLIIDGERRFRVLSELNQPPKVDVQWTSTLGEVFFQSLILNESRAAHNPMERAKAFRKLMDEAIKMGHTTRTVDYVAFRLGIHFNTIYSHLRLLDLPEEVQGQVARGEVPTTQALHLRNTLRRYGQLIKPLEKARAILETISSGQPDDGEGRPQAGILSRKGLRDAQHAARLEGTELDELLEAGMAVGRIVAVTNAVAAAERGVEGIKPRVLRDALRARAMQPPEDLLRRLTETQTRIAALIAAVEPATRPEPLEAIPGKPSFWGYVSEPSTPFTSPIQRTIVYLLAKLSDENQAVMTAAEIAEAIGKDAITVGAVIKKMEPTLKALGLKIDLAWSKGVRVEAEPGKRVRSEFRRVPAYRLKWADDAVPAAAPPVEAPRAKPEPAAAPPVEAPRAKPEPVAAPPVETPRAEPEPVAAPPAKPPRAEPEPVAPVVAPPAAPAPQIPKEISLPPLVQTFVLQNNLVGDEVTMLLALINAGKAGISVIGPKDTRIRQDLAKKLPGGSLGIHPRNTSHTILTPPALRKLNGETPSSGQPTPGARVVATSVPTAPVPAPSKTRDEMLLSDAINPENPLKNFNGKFQALSPEDAARYSHLNNKAVKVIPIPTDPGQRATAHQSLKEGFELDHIRPTDTVVVYWNGKTAAAPALRMTAVALNLTKPLAQIE